MTCDKKLNPLEESCFKCRMCHRHFENMEFFNLHRNACLCDFISGKTSCGICNEFSKVGELHKCLEN